MTEENSQNLKENEESPSVPESSEIVYESESEKEIADAEKLRKKLKNCREEKEKYLVGWQRSQADFINYRRRQEEQMTEWSKMLGEGLIKDILAVLDSLEAAQKSQQENEGIITLAKQLNGILRKHGLSEIKSVGEKFNPQFHEVVESQADGDENAGEMVAEEVQKGYMLNGKVIRAAKVRVKNLNR